MDETKALLNAIIERLDAEAARNEAFRMEMTRFQGETRGKLSEILSQMDYLAGKLGQHDRDLYVIKQKNG